MFTAFVRVAPNSDQVPPFEPRFARQAVVTFLHEYLMADDLTSVVLGTIKSGAARNPLASMATVVEYQKRGPHHAWHAHMAHRPPKDTVSA